MHLVGSAVVEYDLVLVPEDVWECEKSLWTRRVKWAMKVVSMSSPRHKKRLYADQKLCLKRCQDINPNGSFKDINALQSYNLFVSQPPQQGNRYNDTRVWMMDEGKIPYEGQQGLENSQELLWWRGKRWLLTNILIAVVIHGTNLGEQTSSDGFLQSTSFYNCCCLHFATQSNEQWSTFLGFNCSKICLSCHHLLSFTYLKILT